MVLIIRVSCSSNLIINGDFEAYAGISSTYFNGVIYDQYFNLKYGTISSNSSCWYDEAMGVI